MRPLVLLSALSGSLWSTAYAQTLEVEGECPGVVTITAEGLSDAGFVIVRGDDGDGAIPGGPCAGIDVPLTGLSWFGRFRADPAGGARLTPSVPDVDASILVLDLGTCGISSAVPLCSRGGELVGSYLVSDGPPWRDDPAVYNCLEACALLFGGSAGDYACSTSADSVDNLAYVDGWGDSSHCSDPVGEDYSLGDFYDCGFGMCSYSAYVSDHGCDSRNHCFTR